MAQPRAGHLRFPFGIGNAALRLRLIAMVIQHPVRRAMLLLSSLLIADTLAYLALLLLASRQTEHVLSELAPASDLSFDLEISVLRATLDRMTLSLPDEARPPAPDRDAFERRLSALLAIEDNLAGQQLLQRLRRDHREVVTLANLLAQHAQASRHLSGRTSLTLIERNRQVHAEQLQAVLDRMHQLLNDYVRSRTERGRELAKARQQNALFASLGLAVLLVTLLGLGWWWLERFTRRRILAPLSDLTQTARRVASGDLGTRLGLQRMDVFGQAFAEVDAMLDALESRTIVKARLHGTLDAVASYVVVLDELGRINFASARTLNSLGYQTQDCHAQPIGKLFPDLPLPLLVARAVSGREPLALLTRALTAKGELLATEITLSLLSLRGPDRYLLVGNDRSGAEQADRELSAARDMASRIRQALSLSERRERELEWSMLEVAEQEQRRIGRDLHDHLGQRLTGIAFLSSSLKERLVQQAPTLVDDANWITQLINEAIEHVRYVARELSPVRFEGGKLADALHRLTEDYQRIFGISCELVDRDCANLLIDKAASNVYRAIQESINNAVKHGQARTVVVIMERDARRIRIAVVDDGVGFDVRRLPRNNGVGMQSLRSRVELLDGCIRFRSGRNGTLVLISLPLSVLISATMPELA